MAQAIRVRIPHFGELGIAGFRGRIPCAILALSVGPTREAAKVSLRGLPVSCRHPIHNTTHDMHHHRVGAGVVVPPDRGPVLGH